MLEGRNYQAYEDYGCVTTLAVAIASDIEKALKEKEYPLIDKLKAKLPPEIRDMFLLFS